ncbi:hypothetical protein DQP56_11970 [Mycolicibacter senuensis]|nr:hypothetical protein DQP56_11970 [Mycolicibacter senuensis]
MATITPETAPLADYLSADLQRIANSANEKLAAISRSDLVGQARQTAEARVINVARAFAVLRVESTVRQLHKEALEFGTEYVSLTAAPVAVEAPERIPAKPEPPRSAEPPRDIAEPPREIAEPPREMAGKRGGRARHRMPEPVVVEVPTDLAPPPPAPIPPPIDVTPPPPEVLPPAPPPPPPSPSVPESAPVFDLVEPLGVGGGEQESSSDTGFAPEPESAVPLESVVASPVEPGGVVPLAEAQDAVTAAVPAAAEPATAPPSPEPVPAEPIPATPAPPAITESSEQRLQRLLAFVARQEPGLRWAIGTLADGRTLLVTDVAGGWIPSGIELPAGVHLLEPGRRSGTATAMLGAPAESASYSPGDRLGWASDFGATDASVQPRELEPIDDLGWQLSEATHWRDGLPRMANTLAKAGSAGTGVLDAEIDLLRVHLDTLRYQLLAQYPDTDLTLVLNCMLLAATEGVATGDTVAANYHYSWFRALSAPAAGQWDPQA